MEIPDNPFQYEAANNLEPSMIADWYVDDFNYTRFLQSKRNIFLSGERGSGKTMALLYNSWPVQRVVSERQNARPNLGRIGIYVPCNVPLIRRAEFELLDEFRGAVISEHFLSLSVAFELVDTLSKLVHAETFAEEETIRDELELLFGPFPERARQLPVFRALRAMLNRELLETQRAMNQIDMEAFHERTFSFASAVLPIMQLCSREVTALRDTHFLLMIDDAHVLNPGQIRSLNSWIAFRDHSLFSFKVATAKVDAQSKVASSGGAILEGHDYTTIDLEAPYLNPTSNFYKYAHALVKKRLQRTNIDVEPEDFFPENPTMGAELQRCREETRLEGERKYKSQKQISDFVYKYARARYFRGLSSKANLPPYSGFETLVYISTGVVRNLLEPCYWMFDQAISRADVGMDEGGVRPLQFIEPSIQTEVILRLSERRWNWLETELSRDIDECSLEDGADASRLLGALAEHFRWRLHNHKSEPRAVSFTVSNRAAPEMEHLARLLRILRKAQLIYYRRGPAKDDGRREEYYVPNRILWPIRGLDPVGQHARVSLRAEALWGAAKVGKLPGNEEHGQRELLDE